MIPHIEANSRVSRNAAEPVAFTFTPKHGWWLNLVEFFFGKMACAFLRGVRVASEEELRERILRYFDEITEAPIVYRWRYKMDELSVA